MSEFNIKSVQYTSSEQKTMKVVIDDQSYFVPKKINNRHYQAILEWAKEDGNEIQEDE